MKKSFEIENIEEMRYHLGIDDVELKEQIRRLEVGDVVRLTLLNRATAAPGRTLRVRITQIRGSCFRGRLVDKPDFADVSGLRARSFVTFSSSHVHSVLKGHQGSREV